MRYLLDTCTVSDFVKGEPGRAGRPIGPYDSQIAGCGLARGLVVVTSNDREFQRVSGLQLENWRQLPAPT